eukprot:1153805-Pelagomonas_calceolata.AAC.1
MGGFGIGGRLKLYNCRWSAVPLVLLCPLVPDDDEVPNFTENHSHSYGGDSALPCVVQAQRNRFPRGLVWQEISSLLRVRTPQVAALVAKVGRLEKGLGRVPPSPAAANRGAAVQEDKSDVTGPSFQQLQKQITALERQQQELRAVSAHTPTHEQLVALQRQVDELRQQRPALQAKGETTGQGGSSDGTQTQQMLADLVQRLNAAEESLAQMRAMNSSKSPEGFVPRGEMMRAFSLLHDALAPKVKK